MRRPPGLPPSRLRKRTAIQPPQTAPENRYCCTHDNHARRRGASLRTQWGSHLQEGRALDRCHGLVVTALLGNSSQQPLRDNQPQHIRQQGKWNAKIMQAEDAGHGVIGVKGSEHHMPRVRRKAGDLRGFRVADFPIMIKSGSALNICLSSVCRGGIGVACYCPSPPVFKSRQDPRPSEDSGYPGEGTSSRYTASSSSRCPLDR